MNLDFNLYTKSRTILNMTTIQTNDLQIGNVILLQEVSDTSMNETSDNTIDSTEPNCEDHVQPQSLEETLDALQNVTDLNESSNDKLHESGDEPLTTPSDLSAAALEQLKISPIYKITHKKDILKKIQAKTFTPISNVEKTADSTEAKLIQVDPPNVSIEVTVQKMNGFEQMSRKRCRNQHNFFPIPDRIVPPRALAVLPAALQCRRDVITPHRRALPPKVIFGPVLGIKRSLLSEQRSSLVNEAVKLNRPIFLLKNADSSLTYIDVSDQDKSNWLSLLQLGDATTANVWLQQRKDQLYAVTTHSIPPQTPLRLGYCKTYADDHNLQGVPVLDLLTELPKGNTEWWCNECAKAMPSLLQLEIHMDKFHQDFEDKPKGRYRCRYCTRRFARLFCLKRHLLQNCKKRKSDTDDKRAEEAKENDLNSAQHPPDDGGRLTSDESLQNFSNILDISSSLFDADRMSTLDMSGAKSDDFIKMADDIRLTNDFDWMDGLGESVEIVDDVKKFKKSKPPRSSSPISCPYCNLNMSRSKLKQHARLCPWRRFECMCGITFKCKEKLALHVHTTHPITTVQGHGDNVAKDAETLEPKKIIEFTCEHCNMEFKRRGMYINHLAKVHNLSSAHVPLVVRDKRYPCPVCPKLYQAASKRDIHVQNHHPGVQYDRKAWVGGGSRRVAPAACSLCPRQYATRAKLLQHTRKHHYKHYQAMQLSSTESRTSKKSTRKRDQNSLEN